MMRTAGGSLAQSSSKSSKDSKPTVGNPHPYRSFFPPRPAEGLSLLAGSVGGGAPEGAGQVNEANDENNGKCAEIGSVHVNGK